MPAPVSRVAGGGASSLHPDSASSGKALTATAARMEAKERGGFMDDFLFIELLREDLPNAEPALPEVTGSQTFASPMPIGSGMR